MRYLLTQSLISSWQWALDLGTEEKYDEFRATLRREPVEQNEAMLKGIQFEKNVYEACKGLVREPHPEWESGIQKVAGVIKGSQFQVSGSTLLGIDGTDFLLYGIADAIRAGTIYDVKFSTKSFGSAELAGKYLESPQHPAYLQIWQEASRFVYVVSDGEDIYTEEYTRTTTRPFWDVAREFWNSIRSLGLEEEYKKHWEAREQ